jgi:regulator of sigma E protease
LEPLSLLAFILILSLLVFVHELGHFIVAKRAKIVVEEFAIGFPPRAVKLWQGEGQITLDGHEYVIGRHINVPRAVQPGAQVYVETGINAAGRPAITKLQLIKPVGGEAPPQQEQHSLLAKLFASRASKPDAVDESTVITVDALTRPTEYALNWVPFGGYVRMLGEEDPTAAGSFASKSKKARMAVLVAGSTMNLLAAIVFFTLTAMSGVPRAAAGTFILNVLPDTPAAIAGLQANDIIVGADNTEFKYPGDLVTYIDQTKGREIILHIERNGQTSDYPLTPRVNPPQGQGAMGVSISYAPVVEMIVTKVLPSTPAAVAGLQTGDVIVGADNTLFKYAGDMARYLEAKPGQKITLNFQRKGQAMAVALTPDALKPAPQGEQNLGAPVEQQAALGVTLDYKYNTQLNHYPLPQALLSGVTQTAEFVGLTFYMPIAILRNLIPAEAARVTGPVGIYQQTGSAVNAAVTLNWWYPVLWLTAVLSTALAVTNLLPLPALDGGRIFFVIIEAIRGKRISPEKEGAVHFIGLAVLLTLMVVVTYYDVISPLPPIDWTNFFK